MDETPATVTHIVPEDAGGMRLRDFAMTVWRGLSRKGMREAVRRGHVLLDGRRVASNHPVCAGQVVTIQIPQVKRNITVPDGMYLVFADAHMAVVFKPAGVASGGQLKHYIDHLLSQKATGSDESDSLHGCRPVHRLDAATSGLLVAARTGSALRILAQQFERKEVQKKYVAIACGEAPASLHIDTPLDGREAVTRIVRAQQWKTADGEPLSLVELFPETGRTHQLRRHLAMQWLPILGDRKYGWHGDPMGLFLCAVKLTLLHPATGEVVSYEIDPPDMFRQV